MNRYKVKFRDLQSGSESVDFEYADDPTMLASLAEARGLGVVEILEEGPVTIPGGPQPNLDAIADLGIAIDDRAMAQAQQNHRAKMHPGMPPQPSPAILPGVPNMPYGQQPQQPTPPPVIEFVDNGVAYKIEHGQVYKKDWVEVDPTDFRVVRKESRKEIKGDDLLVYRKDWVALEDPKHG